MSEPVTEPRLPCCATWDKNKLLGENGRMQARLDAYPVRPGHALIIPRRHLTTLAELTPFDVLDLFEMVNMVIRGNDTADGYTVAVNDGRAAGRTIDHLHVHVIPRFHGDVPQPEGGVRRMFIPDPADDPWKRGRQP